MFFHFGLLPVLYFLKLSKENVPGTFFFLAPFFLADFSLANDEELLTIGEKSCFDSDNMKKTFVTLLIALTCIVATGASSAKPTPNTPTPTFHETEVVQIAFSPGNAEATILAVINNAKKEIRLAAFTFTSRPVANALLRAKQRGVNVAVVLDEPKKSAKPFIIPFMNKNGIHYRICSKYSTMHHKFIVADGVIVQTGSFNYTNAAARSNAENVVVLKGKECAGVYLGEWNRLWLESKGIGN
jgi:phosphatidylserine/phosphatidylglycerophosphate/cardiolipin synthase-like enzyme